MCRTNKNQFGHVQNLQKSILTCENLQNSILTNDKFGHVQLPHFYYHLQLLLTEDCPTFLWLQCHSKWLRDIRDIAVHLHHLGSIRLTQEFSLIDVEYPWSVYTKQLKSHDSRNLIQQGNPVVPGMSIYFCSHTTLLNDSLLI